MVYLVGFGVPALELSGLPTDPVVLGGIALALAYSAYVAEVYRAGIESVHPSQRAAALAGGPDRDRRRCATSCSRRRCGGSRPRCSTTSSRCRRTSRSSSILGPLEAFRVAQIEAVVELHLHAAARRRAALPLRDRAAGAAARPLGAEAAPVSAPVLEVRGVTKAYGDRAGPARDRPRRARAPRRRADRRLRLGQVDAAALHRPAGGDRRRRRLPRRRRGHGPVGRPGARAPAARDGLPALQPVPPPQRARQRDALARPRARPLTRGGGGARPRAARPLRAGGPRGRPPGRPLRRPAAARRHRPRAGDGPAGAAARRGHQRARSRARRRGARRDPRAQGGRA